MIPRLTEFPEVLGVSAAFVPLALVSVLTATLLFLHSLAQLFDDRNS